MVLVKVTGTLMITANTSWLQLLELREKMAADADEDEDYVDWLERSYGYVIEGYCDHLFINVGFTSITLVCKYCDTEKIK